VDILLMQIGNGLIVGSVYALVALGLNLIWSITDIPDFAQGSFYVLAAYAGLFAVTLIKMPFLVALLCGMSVEQFWHFCASDFFIADGGSAPSGMLRGFSF